jgi:hypothetical protein
MWDARLTFKFGHMRPEIWPYSARMAAPQVEARQELPIIAGASDLSAAARRREVGNNQGRANRHRHQPRRLRRQPRSHPPRSLSASQLSNPGLLAIKDFSQSFCPRGPPGWGRQPEVKWPAAPSLPTTSNCPASNRAMASTDSNGEIASGSAAEPEVGRLYCNCTPQK